MASQDPANLFDPRLATIQRPAHSPQNLPPSTAVPPPPEHAIPTLDEEDWDALMLKARLRAEMQAECPSKEDEWDRLMREARERSDIPRDSPPPLPPAPEEDDEVWEQLMRNALSRESTDIAAAQVVQESVPANDDRGATKLTSLPELEDTDAEATWLNNQSTSKQTEQAEMQRKLRAMHEIRRLRGARKDMQRSLTTEAKPRLALGTLRPPIVTKARRSRSRPARIAKHRGTEDN